MKHVWKIRDYFYNNGIINLFWATQQFYAISYSDEQDILLLRPDKEFSLCLFPHQLVIEGQEIKIQEWYRNISFFFTKLGLEKTPRLVFNKQTNRLEEGFSYKQRPYSSRIWGTAIGSKFISAPSLDKKIPKELVKQALKSYEKEKGKNLNQLDKEGLFKKFWEKDGVYVQVDFETIFSKLFKNRHQFEKSKKEKCEICGSELTRFNGEVYKRDSQTYPTVIGMDYSGFKEFMQSSKMVLCAFCDLALRYNFFWSFYVGGNPNILLHLEYPDLVSLFRLKYEVFDIKMERIDNLNQVTNIPFPDIKHFASAERAILGLALYITRRIATGANLEINYVTGDKSHLLKIVSFYFDSTQISGLSEYHQFNRLVQWLSKQPEKSIVKPLSNFSFKINSNKNQFLVETKLLRNFLDFKDISAPLAEIAILKIRGLKNEKSSIGLSINPFPVESNFENLIVQYYQYIKEFVMNKDQLYFLKDYGWALGTLVKATDDLSIFYELREAKKLDHIVNVFRNFSFKLLRAEETIGAKDEYVKGALTRFVSKDLEIVQLFEALQNEWVKARDLLLFFAVNNYLKKYNIKQGD